MSALLYRGIMCSKIRTRTGNGVALRLIRTRSYLGRMHMCRPCRIAQLPVML